MLHFSNKFSFLFIRKVNPRWLIFAIDVCISISSVVLAFILRFNFVLSDEIIQYLFKALIIIVSLRIISFIITQAYAGIVRYTSTRDLFRILLINMGGSVLLVLINITAGFLEKGHPVPYSVIGIDFFATVFFMVMYRLCVKFLYTEFSYSAITKRKVIIYGSKEMAVFAKRTLELDTNNRFRVMAFISTSRYTTGKHLEGIRVFPPDSIEKVIDKYGIHQLVFASQKLDAKIEQSVIEMCLNKNVRVFKTPPLRDLMDNRSNIRKIRQIKIEDLLFRNTIQLNKQSILAEVKNKTILVTGAAGSIGSEIVRQLLQFSCHQIILFDQAETPMFNLGLELEPLDHSTKLEFIVGDITSNKSIESVFKTYKPDMVFHAAAYKHVPMMEENPVEAIWNNVIGTKNLAELASHYQVKKFVFISTDKAVNPTNVMGASKRIAEIFVQSLNEISHTAFITTRFGNVLGSNGSVVPIFDKQIEYGGPVTITHPDVTRYFMTIPEASQLVLEACACGKGGEIFVFDMGDSVKILDLAKNMIRLAGFTPDVDMKIAFTGLRPGEKLYEELLHSAENTMPTHHPKLMIAKVRKYDYTDVWQRLVAMEDAVYKHNVRQLVLEMKRTVPEFISQNSVFEEIDRELKLDDRLSSLKAI